MATYEYKCEIHGIYEIIHSIHTKLEFCEKCELEGVKTPVVRLISFGKSNLIRVDGLEEIQARENKSMAEFQQRYKNDENFRANIEGESSYQENVIKSEKTLKSMDKKFRQVFGRK